MSVAFRRESDEEHREPRFELPIPPGPNLVTPRGLALLEEKVTALEAMPPGDEAAEAERQRALRYFRTRLATARIAPPPAEGEAGIGTRVTIRLDGAERTIAIVGGDEADPAADRLAFTAPLARALAGAASGETVPFAGRTVEILRVAPL